jgi:sec-independent protein translocase protein TatC
MSEEKKPGAEQPSAPGEHTQEPASSDNTEIHHSQGVDNGYGYGDDPYSYDESGYRYGESTQAPEQQPVAPVSAAAPVAVAPKNPPPKPPPPPAFSSSGGGGGDDDDDGDEEEDGMLRMSFLEHLEELRTRIIRALMGFAGAFAFSLIFANELWRVISDPAITALKNLGYKPAQLVAITPLEQFSTIWVKAPMVVSIFLASPIVLYQVWGFISPGLYKRERRWAIPFILCTSGLFIAGGLFAYFVVFRFGLEFLLGVGRDANVAAMVTISEYFDLFVNVTLGVGIVFELPVLIFFLTLIRIASPRFLLENARYAVLGIMVLAAIITPTPDIFNLMLFAVPMMLLFFVGVFASYLLELNREGKKFPWKWVLLALLGVLLVLAGIVWLLVAKFGFKLLTYWPFLTK